MSNIAIKGATTGTGVFTLESPATNTDRTLVLPDEAGTVLTSASNVAQKGVPAFRVYLSGTQTTSTNVNTKVMLNTESFDTASAFDSATDYRFQPTIAGHYLLTANVSFVSNSVGLRYGSIRINGVEYSSGQCINTGNNWTTVSVSCVAYFNGSSDYAELYGKQISGGNLDVVPYSSWTNMTGVLVRAD